MDLRTSVLACVIGYLLKHIVSQMLFCQNKKNKKNTTLEFTLYKHKEIWHPS
jgi:hypothetical protein